MSDQETRGRDAELAEFRTIIEKKIAKAEEDLALLENNLRNMNNGTDDTSQFKLEEGSITMSKERNSQLASRQEKFIRDLRNAIVRIETKRTASAELHKLIEADRLKLVPHATLSMEAKLNQR